MGPDEVSPVEETENTTEAVAESKEEAPPEATEPEKEEAQAEPEEDVRDKELKRLERELRKAHRNNSKLHQQLETRAAEPKASSEEIDVEALANQKAEAKTYAKDAERMVESGKKANADFMDRLKDLAEEVGPFVQPNGLPTPFMQAVRDISEDPAKLLYHLGKNPDLASDLADLPVTKLAARLDRIEREMNAKPKTSSAPKPLEPIKPRGSVAKDPSQMTDKEFADWRRHQIAQRH